MKSANQLTQLYMVIAVPRNQLIQLHIDVCCATQAINTVTYGSMLCNTIN
jgi:hypothetical protein